LTATGSTRWCNADAGKLEVHRNCIDIQVALGGVDTMGWRPTPTCAGIVLPYRAGKDDMLFADRPTAWTAVGPGEFAIFFLEDAHLPRAALGDGEYTATATTGVRDVAGNALAAAHTWRFTVGAAARKIYLPLVLRK
jgi:hypothetical protein